MKKQILMAVTIAALGVSFSASAAQMTFTTPSGGVAAANIDRKHSITGNVARYITDTYNFQLSEGVGFAFFQDAESMTAIATTARGSLKVFGGNTSTGIAVCGGAADGTNNAPTLTTPTSHTACGGYAS